MFVHTSGFRKVLSIPSYILDDDNVSIGAKGLFVQLFYSNDKICSLKELEDYTSTKEEELKTYFNELAEAGYVVISEKRCDLRHKALSSKKAAETDITQVTEYAETTQPKKKSAYDFIVDTINTYDLPTNVKALLTTYFSDWLNRKGRFAEASPLHKYKVMHVIGEFISYHLSEPDMIACIQQSIDKGWYKLVIPKNTSSQFDKSTLTSGSYTKDDIEEIKRRAAEINKDGEKGIF